MDWPSELKYRPTENTEKTQAYEFVSCIYRILRH